MKSKDKSQNLEDDDSISVKKATDREVEKLARMKAKADIREAKQRAREDIKAAKEKTKKTIDK